MEKLTIGKSYRIDSETIGVFAGHKNYGDAFSFFIIKKPHKYIETDGHAVFETEHAEAFTLIEEPFTKEQFIKDTCDFLDAIDAICDDYEQRQTQKQRIFEYLKTGKPITKLEALKMFGCWNSGDAIFDLRKEGHTIETTMITNGKKRFASYKLIEK